MIRIKIHHTVAGLAVAALTLAACTDTWDDHYESAVAGVNEGSLWQAISSNPDLSNFASVVEACGYSTRLNGTQMFTVFAPVNSQFSKAEADALIAQFRLEDQDGKGVKEENNTVVKEFLQNHIALYNYSVAQELPDDDIVMMNGKYQTLGYGQFGTSTLLSRNALYGNGVLFTLDRQVPFFANIFEYIKKDAELDSLRSFLYNELFYREEFQEDQSVAGGLDSLGRTVYLDSVFVQRNELFSILDAELNDEDSTYWMVAPTNQVWQQLVEEYTPYFQYEPQVTDLLTKGDRDSLIYTSVRRAIVEGTVFSRTTNTDRMLADSAMSTAAVLDYSRRAGRWGNDTLAYYQYMKPLQAPDGVLTGTTDVACSNGRVMKADDWKIAKNQTFAREIIIEVERAIKERGKDGKGLETTTPSTRTVSNDNPFYNRISGHSYVEFTEENTNVQHNITLNITNVLSNLGYDIYLVSVPAIAGDTLAGESQRLPTTLRFTLGYHDADGTELTKQTVSSITTHADSLEWLPVATNFKFPVCSFNVNEAEPQVTLRVETRVGSSALGKTQSRQMRFDCIVLKPHEE